MKEIEEDIENIKEGDFTEEKNSINKLKKYSVNYIEEVLKRTKVKVIFIDGEEDFEADYIWFKYTNTYS